MLREVEVVAVNFQISGRRGVSARHLTLANLQILRQSHFQNSNNAKWRAQLSLLLCAGMINMADQHMMTASYSAVNSKSNLIQPTCTVSGERSSARHRCRSSLHSITEPTQYFMRIPLIYVRLPENEDGSGLGSWEAIFARLFETPCPAVGIDMLIQCVEFEVPIRVTVVPWISCSFDNIRFWSLFRHAR